MTVQGHRAGEAAAEYADAVGSVDLPTEKVDSLIEGIMAPASMEKGYEPSWVRDVLHGIMAPGWITIAKNETALSSALDQVHLLQDLVSGRMIAENGHDLRLCHEVEHQLVAMELKLRAGLERKESRGNHYRTDYPFHDDDYLYYLTFTKDENGGEPTVGKVELPDRWKGDMDASYIERYPTMSFPEEFEKYGDKEEKKS